MPLHLNSITNDSPNNEILAWMLKEGMDECASIFITEDQKYLHIRCNLTERLFGVNIGKMVYTLLQGEKARQILMNIMRLRLLTEDSILNWKQ